MYFLCVKGMLRVKRALEANIHRLEGSFVCASTNYEPDMCRILNWECIDNRYYDASDGECFIEIKKGQSGMWFNMIRYAEIYVNIGQQGTITIFARYSKKQQRVLEVFIIDTKEILNFLHMVPTKAACCILLNKDSKRNLHMQAGATVKDMREMASYVVKHPKYKMEKCLKGILSFKGFKKSKKRKRT